MPNLLDRHHTVPGWGESVRFVSGWPVCGVADRCHNDRWVSELVSGYVDYKAIRLNPGMAHPPIGGEQAAILTNGPRCLLWGLATL